ncbi:amino acid ABC transporter substrate-binding protein [Promicromonospora thailandica]|uniref:Cystine transport system substrate-binding protein n=1 Tax=Promicromonospora thailandica TaxID=765201 RepID=A0A9X2G403_9MICO|nr:amino acid ABC transporter substrate-binding protein [Promicromonospora thailandica]MCP2265108.1 cystine transport system substrate-binding protein [Promicromonospora thailandica]BFF19825.1 amino acid ABC transporter substrate-binding protein [Promicromonospora thailandica]
MSRNRALLSAAAASAALLALTGCGSSGESGDAGDDLGLSGDTLVVATEGTYRPFSFHDESGELVGYDVEIAEAVAENLGLEIEFQETQWDAIFAGLDAGRFDTIANQVTITPEREADYVFSAPYTVSTGVLVVAADNEDIRSFADLDGKTSAQSLTSNWNDLATESGATVEAVEGWAQAVALLEQGRVDATINDSLTYLDYANTEDASGIKVAAETEEQSEAAFVVTPEREALAQAIDGALDDLRADGTLAELGEKYFGEDVSE